MGGVKRGFALWSVLVVLVAWGCEVPLDGDAEDFLEDEDRLVRALTDGFELQPDADAYVSSSSPNAKKGRRDRIKADQSPEKQALLRFTVPSFSGKVSAATLKLYLTNASRNGPEVYKTSNDWSETAVTWNNRPSQQGSKLFDLGETSTGWVSMDVTSAVTGPGSVSFILIPDSTDSIVAYSREGSSSRAPRLVVTLDGDGGDSGDGGDVDGDDDGAGGGIKHIGTTKVWDSNGQSIKIARPSGSRAGDLLVLFLHRTDDDLPLYVDGWERVAECFKRDNGYDCSTEDDCESWHNDDFCADFGRGGGGHDLAQSVFFKKVGSSEASSYTFHLNRDSSGHPGWVILTALRGANTSDPVRDWSGEGCDGNPDSVFPSVYGQRGDMVLLSQSFDDAVAQSKFQAPDRTALFGYVSNSDEAGFLFGGVLSSSGETGTMKTHGEGASSCKDALVSLTIRPQ